MKLNHVRGALHWNLARYAHLMQQREKIGHDDTEFYPPTKEECRIIGNIGTLQKALLAKTTLASLGLGAEGKGEMT